MCTGHMPFLVQHLVDRRSSECLSAVTYMGGASKLQGFPDETDPFYYSFRPDYVMATFLVTW